MSSTTAIAGRVALEKLPDLQPGLKLAVLAEAFGERLGELNGCQLVDFVAAVRRQVAHLEAVGLQAAHELSLRPPGDQDSPPVRLEFPEERAAGELEMACGWSRRRADGYVSLAFDLGNDLTATRAALDAGEIEADTARVIADGATVLMDNPLLRRRAEAAVLVWIRDGLADGMRYPCHKVRKRVEREVLRLDPDAAKNRHGNRVQDRNLGLVATGDSIADLAVSNLPADQAAEAYAHVNALAKVAKRTSDERTMPQLRADIAVSLLSGTANVIGCPSQQHSQQPGRQPDDTAAWTGSATGAATAARPSGRVVVVTTFAELAGTSSGNSTLSWVGAIGSHVAERIARTNLDNPDMDYEIVVTDPRSGRVFQVHQLGGLFRGRLRELVEITRPSCDWYTCDRPSIDCEIDHRTERSKHGATDLRTGGPKCRSHHRDKNKGDWRDQPLPDAETRPGEPAYRLVGPFGHSFPIQPTQLIPFPDAPPPF